MRKQVHRLCVEISRDSHRNVDMPDERLQLFRLDFPGAVGGMAATANLRIPDSECQQGRANRGVDSFKRDGGSSPRDLFLSGRGGRNLQLARTRIALAVLRKIKDHDFARTTVHYVQLIICGN
jgi:hypothetical protein